jgi:hypothetical protein
MPIELLRAERREGDRQEQSAEAFEAGVRTEVLAAIGKSLARLFG